MKAISRSYPRFVECGDSTVELRLMSAADAEPILEFARSLPQHDLLFLRRDITEPRVVSAWIDEIERGTIVSLVAMKDGKVVGSTAIVRDDYSWSPHVGELRLVTSPDVRGIGLGRILAQESFALALELELEKLVAYMTVDQRGAIAVFEDLGFRGEALLSEHVRDRDGQKHDLVILSHNVALFQAQMEAYGLPLAV